MFKSVHTQHQYMRVMNTATETRNFDDKRTLKKPGIEGNLANQLSAVRPDMDGSLTFNPVQVLECRLDDFRFGGALLIVNVIFLQFNVAFHC